MTTWGGPAKKIHGVLIGWIAFGIFSGLLYGLGRSFPVWIAASFLMMLFNPMLNGSNQAIWQAKTAHEVQGRVFSVRRLVAQITAPISMAVAGPLADQVFEPAIATSNSWMRNLLGNIFGLEPGSGMSILISIYGVLIALVGIGAFQIKSIREVETLVPDHQGVEQS